jgi:hypothetical protein
VRVITILDEWTTANSDWQLSDVKVDNIERRFIPMVEQSEFE